MLFLEIWTTLIVSDTSLLRVRVCEDHRIAKQGLRAKEQFKRTEEESTTSESERTVHEDRLADGGVNRAKEQFQTT